MRVSEVQCNCRQSQPYLPVKNTIIPHSPAKQFLLSLPPSTPFLSLSFSLPASNYNLEGYFSPGQKHSPLALPSLSDSSFSLSLFTTLDRPFPLLRVGEWNEQAVNTHHLL